VKRKPAGSSSKTANSHTLRAEFLIISLHRGQSSAFDLMHHQVTGPLLGLDGTKIDTDPTDTPPPTSHISRQSWASVASKTKKPIGAPESSGTTEATTKTYHALRRHCNTLWETEIIIPDDMWVCGTCGQSNLITLYPDNCPSCGTIQARQPEGRCGHPRVCRFLSSKVTNPECDRALPKDVLEPASSMIFFDGPGALDSNFWQCNECAAVNSGLTPDFCPVCGVSR
jgi:rubrerythrin